MKTSRILHLADRIKFWHEIQLQAIRYSGYQDKWIAVIQFCQTRKAQAIQTLKSYLNETPN